MRSAKQSEFDFEAWGGARAGAGRTRKSERACVVRTPRPALEALHPVHVTLRITDGLESLRCRSEYRIVRDAPKGTSSAPLTAKGVLRSPRPNVLS